MIEMNFEVAMLKEKRQLLNRKLISVGITNNYNKRYRG